MDNIAVRSRYPRHSVSARSKKRNTLENNSYRDKLARQLVIAVLILMVAGIIKSADTTVTNFISVKFTGILTQNMDIQGIYKGIGDVIDKVLKKDGAPNNNKAALPTSSPSDIDEGIKSNSPITAETIGEEIDLTGGEKVQGVTTITPTPKPAPTPSPKAVSPTTTQSMFITPVSGLLGDTFGERIHPVTNKLTQHKGIDIEAVQNASIKAAAAGEVIDAGFEKTLGYYVKISHSNSFSTIYAHCNELLAKKGQKVKQGDIIAKAGSTGLSTGTHLHFEIWKDGKVVNPLDYIKVPEK